MKLCDKLAILSYALDAMRTEKQAFERSGQSPKVTDSERVEFVERAAYCDALIEKARGWMADLVMETDMEGEQ